MHRSSEARRRWRLRHPEARKEERKKYYGRSRRNKWNNHQLWNKAADKKVLAQTVSDFELSQELGRTLAAIQTRRVLLKKEAEERKAAFVSFMAKRNTLQTEKKSEAPV